MKKDDEVWYFPAKDEEIYDKGRPHNAMVQEVKGNALDLLLRNPAGPTPPHNPMIRRDVLAKAVAAPGVGYWTEIAR